MNKLLLTIQLALADSINPCTIGIQTILLSYLLSKSKRDAIIGGILFSLTVMFTYYLYGIILKYFIITYYGLIKDILIFLLLIMIIMELNGYFNYRPGFISLEMPLFLRRYCKKILNIVYNPIITIPIAFIISLFLLPCSSGPYFIFLTLTNDIKLTIIYLLIFISPMLLITFLVPFILPQKILEWREKNIRIFHLISGILLISILIYVIK